MKTLHFIIMIILFPIVALSQNLEKIDNKGEAQRNNKNEIGFFNATANVEAITDKNDFFSGVLNIAKTDEYKFEKKGDSEKERHFELYYQYFGGVPVKDGVYVLHWKNGKLESANGNYIRIDKLEPKPTFTEKEALEIWCNYQNIPASEISRSKIELLVVDLNAAEETNAESKVVLAYRIRLYSTHIRNWLIGYVDAHTGEVCLTEPIAITCAFSGSNTDQNFISMPLASAPPPPATGTFATRYSGAQNAITESRNNQFFLEDWTRTNGIITRNRNNLNAADTSGVTPFADNNNNWTTAEWDNAAKDNAALDVHWALQRVYDYYLNVQGRRGWDSLGQRTNAYVHSLIYDGYSLTKDNAAYYPGEYLAFGDGESTFKPLASVDVVAHEYAHGINGHTSNFGSSGLVRSFNEGLSDIWAAAIEGSVAPQKNRWKIGEEVMLVKSCLRNISNPSDATAHTKIAHTFETSEYNSNTDAYYRSGIISHWFYLLSDGGSGTNGLGNSYTVYGLGIETAARLVYFAQAGRRLNGTTTYPLMRTNMMSAANVLFGANSFQSLQVANAWYAVGVGTNPGQVTLSGPNQVCSSGSTFTANNPPSGSTISWSVTEALLEVYSGGSSATPSIRAYSSSISGSGRVQVNFTSNGITTAGPSQTVWVGPPNNSLISAMVMQGPPAGNQLCLNTYMTIAAGHSAIAAQGVNGYSWGFGNWAPPYFQEFSPAPGPSQSRPIFYLPTGAPTSQVLTISAQNLCYPNTTPPFQKTFYAINCGFSLLFAPNPANDNTEVTLANTNETDNASYTVKVTNQYGQVLLVDEKSGKRFTLPTSTLKDGVYIIEVVKGKEVYRENLVVKH